MTLSIVYAAIIGCGVVPGMKEITTMILFVSWRYVAIAFISSIQLFIYCLRLSLVCIFDSCIIAVKVLKMVKVKRSFSYRLRTFVLIKKLLIFF